MQTVLENFSSLNLSPMLTKAIAEMGFTTPTPIQAQTIPAALEGKDLIGCAQTGSGKTAAFCIPLAFHLEKVPGKTALILVPTREIAAQIITVLAKLLKHMPKMQTALVIGGASMNVQLKALARKPSIIVATPGRLVDHLRRRSVSLTSTEYLVLDEADRMLDMGFAPQLREILKYLTSKQRQTLLFSATMPQEAIKLAAQYLKNPQRITIGQTEQTAPEISQEVLHSNSQKKNDVLVDELNARQGSVLIFARTKRRTDRLARFLEDWGFEVGRIHGDRSQAQRNSALDNFRKGKSRILVATDVAARGIDVPHIAHVINYDLPQCPEDYIHRIGRTARAGAKGRALSILTPEDKSMWKDISRLLDRR